MPNRITAAEPERFGRQYVFTPTEPKKMGKRKTLRGPEKGKK